MAELDQLRAKLIVVGLLLSACERPLPENGSGRSTVTAADSSVRAQPGYVVDSILPPGEALRRFRVGGGLDTPAFLDGPRSRRELVARFNSAVRNRDRAALGRLVITRAEFGFLVYPELPTSRPPYRQPPEIAWLLLDAATGAGVEKLVTQGASRFALLDHACPTSAESYDTIRVYVGCTVRVREDGTERNMKLFGRIVERDGRWKFISLDGDL